MNNPKLQTKRAVASQDGDKIHVKKSKIGDDNCLCTICGEMLRPGEHDMRFKYKCNHFHFVCPRCFNMGPDKFRELLLTNAQEHEEHAGFLRELA
jgi:hypothetical protein